MTLKLGRRGALPTDIDALFALRADALRGVVDGFDANAERARFAAAFKPGAHVVLLDGAVIVAIMLVERRRHEILVHELIVDAQWRRQGIASALVRELVDEAVRASLPVAMHVPPRAAGSIAFLKQLGFVVVPSRERGWSRLVWSST